MLFVGTLYGIVSYKYYRQLFLAAIAGLLLGSSLIHPWLWPLVFLGIALTFYLISQSSTPRQAFLFGWCIGTIKILISLVWFWSTYPLDWLGLEPGVLHMLLLFLYWIPAGMTLGLGMGLVAWFFIKFCKKLPKPLTAIIVSFLRVFAEVLGAIIFSVYTLGPGSNITLGFSFGHTGYAVVSLGVFKYVAMLGSVYLLGFTVAFISYLTLTLQWKHKILFVSLIFFLIFFIPAPSNHTPKKGIQVAITETNFLPDSKTRITPPFDRQEAYNDLVLYALASQSDVIVLPEDSRFSGNFMNKDQVFDFLRFHSKKDVVLVDSMRVDSDEKTVLRAYIYDTASQQRFEFDKQYLVPQGEYIPYIYKILISTLGPEDITSRTIADTKYEPGILQGEEVLGESIPPILFCFESVTPFGVFSVKRNESPFVAHLVSHGWFKREPEILWNQLDNMLRTQALFNNIPIVQSSNLNQAKIYWPDGSIEQPELVAESGYWKLYITNI